jgi:hypothetical protein
MFAGELCWGAGRGILRGRRERGDLSWCGTLLLSLMKSALVEGLEVVVRSIDSVEAWRLYNSIQYHACTRTNPPTRTGDRNIRRQTIRKDNHRPTADDLAPWKWGDSVGNQQRPQTLEEPLERDIEPKFCHRPRLSGSNCLGHFSIGGGCHW